MPSVPWDGSCTNPNRVSVDDNPVHPYDAGSGVEGAGWVVGDANEPAIAGVLPENITLSVVWPSTEPLIQVPVIGSFEGSVIDSGL